MIIGVHGRFRHSAASSEAMRSGEPSTPTVYSMGRQWRLATVARIPLSTPPENRMAAPGAMSAMAASNASRIVSSRFMIVHHPSDI